jgi:hypothetical protein
VSRQQFIQAVGPTSNQQVEQVLVKVHRWTDKQVAHFTAAPNSDTKPMLRGEAIRIRKAEDDPFRQRLISHRSGVRD